MNRTVPAPLMDEGFGAHLSPRGAASGEDATAALQVPSAGPQKATSAAIADRRLLRPNLFRARPEDDGGDGCNENVHVQPERPIADIESILRALGFKITLAARGYLPQPGQAWWNAGPEGTEPGVESLEMVLGEGTWSDEAHVPAYDVPQLGQLIQAGSAQKGPDPRQNARVVGKLEVALPLLALLCVAGQHLLKPVLGILVHGAELEDGDGLAVVADTRLPVECRARVADFDGQGEKSHHRCDEDRQWHGQREIENPLGRARQGIRRSCELQGGEKVEMARLQARAGKHVEPIDEEDPLEIPPRKGELVARKSTTVQDDQHFREFESGQFQVGRIAQYGQVGARFVAPVDRLALPFENVADGPQSQGGVLVQEPCQELAFRARPEYCGWRAGIRFPEGRPQEEIQPGAEHESDQTGKRHDPQRDDGVRSHGQQRAREDEGQDCCRTTAETLQLAAGPIAIDAQQDADADEQQQNRWNLVNERVSERRKRSGTEQPRKKAHAHQGNGAAG